MRFLSQKERGASRRNSPHSREYDGGLLNLVKKRSGIVGTFYMNLFV